MGSSHAPIVPFTVIVSRPYEPMLKSMSALLYIIDIDMVNRMYIRPAFEP